MATIDGLYAFEEDLTMCNSDLNTVGILLISYARHLKNQGYPELASKYREDGLRIATILNEEGYYDLIMDSLSCDLEAVKEVTAELDTYGTDLEDPFWSSKP